MRVVIGAWVVAGLLAMTSPAVSQVQFRADDLLAMCDSKSRERECLMFISGVAMGHLSSTAISKSKAMFCNQPGVTWEQSGRIVAAYIRRNPKVHHLEAAHVGLLALAAEFPCR